MKKILSNKPTLFLLIALCLLPITSFAQTGFNKFYTVKVAGGTAYPYFWPDNSSLLPDSGVSLSGYYAPQLSGACELSDGGPYLMRLDKSGAVKFARYYQSPSCKSQFASGGTHFPLPDGGFMLTGSFVYNGSALNAPSSAYTMRIDQLGNIKYFKYTKPSSGSNGWTGAVMTKDSNLVVSGLYNSSPGDIYVKDDISLFKIDASGTQQWGKIFRAPKGAPSTVLSQLVESIHDMDTVADGGIAFVGDVHAYHPEIFQPGTGDTVTNPNSYMTNALIAKVDGSGNLLWSKAVHVNDSAAPYSQVGFTEIISLPDGGFLVSGSYNDFYHGLQYKESGPMLAKLDKDGNLLWMKVYKKAAGNNFSNPAGVLQELTDGYLFTINYPGGEIWFSGDAFYTPRQAELITIKTDFNGKVLWAKTDNIKKAKEQSYYMGVASTNAYLYANLLFKNKPSRIVQAYSGYSKGGILNTPSPSLAPPLTQRDTTIAVISGEMGVNVYCADGDSLKKWLTGYETCLIDVVLDTLSIDIGKMIKITNDVLVQSGTLTTSAVTYNAFDLPIQRILNPKDTIYCDGTKTYILDFKYYPFAGGGNCVGYPQYFTSYSFGYAYYHWDFGDPNSGVANTTFPLNSPPQHVYQTSGTYTVTLIGYSNDSTITDTVTTIVTIVSNKFITVSEDISICSGSSTLLTAGGGVYTYYNWRPTVSLSDTTILNPIASPTSTTTYIIIGNNGVCTDTGSVTITVQPLPTLSISGATSVCFGKSITLTATGSGNGYLWNTGASTASIFVNPTKDSTYSVSTFIEQCSDSISHAITVLATTSISAGPDQTVLQGTEITLTPSGGTDYNWYTMDGIICNNCNTIYEGPDKTTTYYLSETGVICSEDSVTIYVLNCLGLYVPTAFSPNGDGTNDVLYLKNDCVKQLDFKIYDRWGNVVFASINAANGWDGTYKGEVMDPAVFVYYVNAVLGSGETINDKGNVSLVR